MSIENFENLKHYLQGSSPDDAVICPPGHYCEEGSPNAVPCEKGLYSVPSNIFISFPSPIWYINFKLLKLVDVWVNELLQLSQRTARIPSLMTLFAGTFTELEGQTECGECKAGMYCPGNGTALSCEKGYYCPVNTSDYTVSFLRCCLK